MTEYIERERLIKWAREFFPSALNLINCQKLEIERLQESGKEAVSCFTRMESLYKIKCKELEVAKSEAIKEFAEWLKEGIQENHYYTSTEDMGNRKRYAHITNIKDFSRYIDNLVKEMTEVSE